MFRYADTLYWLVITASTIGYGDYYPVTDLGKIAMVIYLSGIFIPLLGARTFQVLIYRLGILKSPSHLPGPDSQIVIYFSGTYIPLALAHFGY